MSFYEGHMLQLYIANFLYGFNPFKLLDCIKFPNFDGLNDVFPRKCRKIPADQKNLKATYNKVRVVHCIY